MDKKYFIWGGYGVGNLGDDILLTSVIGILNIINIPNKNIFIRNNSNNEYLQKLFPGVTLVKDTEKIDVDCIIFGGGTQFFSYPPPGNIITRQLRLLKEYVNSRQVIIKRGNFNNIIFKKSVALGIGVGPFKGNIYIQKLLKKWVEACDYISVRDREAFAYINNFGLTASNLLPDLAFDYRMWYDGSLESIKGEDLKKPEIKIIVRSWYYGGPQNNYISPLLATANTLNKLEFKVDFISFSENKDRALINQLNNRGIEVLAWNPLVYSITEFVNKIFINQSIVVSSRAHGIVLSLLFTSPSISILLDEKLKLIQGNCFEENYNTWSYPYNPQELLKNINYCNSNYLKISQHLRTCVYDTNIKAVKGRIEYLDVLKEL